jgi:hypothetical protein
MQPEKENSMTRMTGSQAAPNPQTSRFTRRLRGPQPVQGVLFALLLIVLAACAPGEAPPAAICDTYDRALFTTQLMGGAAIILGLAVLGFKKNLSAILPSQGAQLGTVAGSVGLGLILLAFSTDIGNQILTGFGIESLYTLCGLG